MIKYSDLHNNSITVFDKKKDLIYNFSDKIVNEV